ncbi:MAG TPA: histidine kinase [Acidimicrobiales bacterium]|nr:histidine kinase [Acidimicrobiales bacterium]
MTDRTEPAMAPLSSRLKQARAGRPPLTEALNLASLGCLVYGVDTEAHLGLGGWHLAALWLTVAASAAWVVWLYTRYVNLDTACVAALVLMSASGGVLASYAPLGMVYVGVAALGATIRYGLSRAGGVGAIGLLAMVIAVIARHQADGLLAAGLAVVLGGMVLGLSRYQASQQAEQAAMLKVAKDRAEIESGRAHLLDDRNRLAREIHDVLAHTLSALSLQLEAMRTTVDSTPGTPPSLADQLEQTQRLVREGLDEARGAVRALRDDVKPLTEQLENLCEQRQAVLVVSGAARPVGPEAGLALYRVAQEALTNVVKHAPGAATEVGLAFAENTIRLSIENSAPNGSWSRSPAAVSLATSGGGYGLQGVRERVTLLGGRVQAGPSTAGWRVEAEVPA